MSGREDQLRAAFLQLAGAGGGAGGEGRGGEGCPSPHPLLAVMVPPRPPVIRLLMSCLSGEEIERLGGVSPGFPHTAMS